MEYNGIINEITDEQNGFILGEDGKEYIFNRLDFIGDKEIVIGRKVSFKPNSILTSKTEILYATLILIEE